MLCYGDNGGRGDSCRRVGQEVFKKVILSLASLSFLKVTFSDMHGVARGSLEKLLFTESPAQEQTFSGKMAGLILLILSNDLEMNP